MGIPAGAPRPTDPTSAASVNAAAALRNYKLQPRLDYSTITGVSGPLVVCQFVKVSTTQRVYVYHAAHLPGIKYEQPCDAEVTAVHLLHLFPFFSAAAKIR